MTQDEINQIKDVVASGDDPTVKIQKITEKLDAMANMPQETPPLEVKEWALKYGFFILAILGFALDIAGLFFSQLRICNPGVISATAFLFLIVGVIFYFPDIISEAKDGPSTIRLVVITIILIFAFIYIKGARNASSLDALKIDQSWIGILGLAFGAKVVQKFSENK